MKTLVIAEPGCTAEGSYQTMVRLLKTAHACGADVWKPQWTSDPDAMVRRRKAPEIYRRYYGWLQWDTEWHADFRDRCHSLGMKYACSVYLPQDVAIVAPFVKYLKIASFENQDAEMERACRETVYPSGELIVSTGMLERAEAFGWRRHMLHARFLHCTSAYPAPLEAINLSAMSEEGLDGLSDHSRNLVTGAVAVGLGAEIIETHYRLDDCDPNNPDYAVAFTPAEFTQYIKNVRDAELMLGDGVKKLQPCEEPYLTYRI